MAGPASLLLDQASGLDRPTRHNLMALGLDFALFLIGMSFAPHQTILPAFAAHLGAPNVVIGAIPAVMTAGWLLPSLFVAHHTETLARKLPFILKYTVWERVPFPALALVAFLLAEPAPRLALVLLLGLLLVMTGIGGVLMPAWMDVMGRTIPTSLRGRFFALAHLVASLGGVVASLASAYILAAHAPPAGYGVCFLAGAVFLGLSYLALLRAREPEAVETSPPVPLRTYLSRIPAVMRRDRNLSWFLAARLCGVIGTMATGFYTVFALRAHAASDWQVALFTTLLLVGQMVGNLGLGWLADRAGHRLVLLAGVAATVVGNLVALAASSLETFSLVFPLSGIHLAAINISARTVLLEFAPTVGERPTYLGLGNTALAPVSLGAPLLAGVLADTLGFGTIFALAAGFGIIAFILTARVRDPRRNR
ncbi:MAG: MFS transporter [Candidatus Rokuibacteriota bacterium]